MPIASGRRVADMATSEATAPATSFTRYPQDFPRLFHREACNFSVNFGIRGRHG